MNKAHVPSSILAAMEDQAIFAPHFRGDSWAAWKAFLGALFALPLQDDQRAVYSACTGRAEPPANPFSEAALIVGRRGGKSRVLALIAVYLATFKDYTPHLAPGEVATVAVLAANRAQARSIFRYTSGILKETPLLAPLVRSETAESIELANRVAIEISTASFRTTRGYSFAAVLADEIAFWSSDEGAANPDIEILRALRPGMASIPGSILLLASSPYAKRGALYATFRKHYGKDDARVLVWKADTSTMNPKIDPAIIKEAYEEDPEAARAEYGAEFRDDLADFVTREIVDAVTAVGRMELPPQAGVVYSAFIDPSGGMSDAMTLAIAHMSETGIVVLDAVREIRPPFDPEATVREFAATLRQYGIDRVTGDKYGGEWPRQRFREHGVVYDASARPKSDLYLGLLPLLTTGRVELLSHPRLAAQLVSLERRTARSGKDSVDHIPGGHDDIANAVAGAIVGLDLDRRPALIRREDLLVAGQPADVMIKVDFVFAVLVVDRHGFAATVYFAKSQWAHEPLQIIDLDYEALTPSIFQKIANKLQDLVEHLPVRAGILVLYTMAPFIGLAAKFGFPTDTIPDEMLDDLERVAFSASGYILAGRVKLTTAAQAKAEELPFGGALDFRAGNVDDGNPLRAAALIGIVLDLDTTWN